MRMRLPAAASVVLLAGCGAPAVSGSPPTASSTTVGATGTTPTAARQRCQAAFAEVALLAWADGTVEEFRRYQYGGPAPTRPLADAFADLPGNTRGAWCATTVSPDTVRWSAVVNGHPPVTAIEITGPGEGTVRGEVQGPPVVP